MRSEDWLSSDFQLVGTIVLLYLLGRKAGNWPPVTIGLPRGSAWSNQISGEGYVILILSDRIEPFSN